MDHPCTCTHGCGIGWESLGQETQDTETVAARRAYVAYGDGGAISEAKDAFVGMVDGLDGWRRQEQALQRVAQLRHVLAVNRL